MNLKETEFNHIGLIPINWDVVRLKDIAQINKGSVFDEKLASVDGIYPYINGGIYPSDWSNHFNTKENTIAVSEGGASAGYTQFMTTKYWAGSHCYKIQSKNKMSDNKYLFYVLKGFEKYLMIEKTGSAMPNLQKTKFINYLVSFVNDIEEQNKIVTFLDQETSKIDRKISILEQKFEKLEEYKQSVIFETVTKGLDSNVAMKDSGIVSIGATPNTWKVSRIKDLFEIGRGRVIAASEVEKEQTGINNYPVYSAATENNGIIGYINTFDFNQPLLTWTTDGAKAGTVFIRDGKFNCTNVCGTLIAKNKQKNLKFYKYALEVQTPHYKRADINGAKIMNNEMAAILIAEPSSEEDQNKIVDYLDNFTSKIEKKVEIIKKQIELLKEYKQTIIYEAVTGKI